jgi:capsular exopolysaccharide synthesis family protein
LKKEKNHLLQAIEEQQQRLKEVPKQEQQLEQLSRHFMVNEKIYSYLLEKRAETAILASSTISNTRVVQKALPPSSPVKPNRKLIVLIGFILGLVLGVSQAVIRNFFDNTIKRNEDIERLTDIPLYGTLPVVKEPSRMPAYIEAVRSLWVNLAFVRGAKESKVIAVTSNISGEGKTFTIYHLSKMIAKSSAHRVIVLDMDMRRSTLHEKFHMHNTQKGVSTVLSGAYSVEEAIVQTSYDNLDVMFSGPKAPNPTRLIMSDAFESLIETLSRTYDYILIDTPPIGIVSDAMRIMHYADLVLFMVKAEYSKKEFIKTINRMNEHEEVNLGIVLNGVDYTKSYYYYGYKHDYMDNYYQQIEEEKA